MLLYSIINLPEIVVFFMGCCFPFLSRELRFPFIEYFTFICKMGNYYNISLKYKASFALKFYELVILFIAEFPSLLLHLHGICVRSGEWKPPNSST